MDEILTRAIADWLIIPIALIGGFAMLRIPAKLRYKAITKAIIAGLVALLFAKIASLFYQGERPFVELGTSPGAAYLPNPGFPSDHSLLVFTVVFVVWASTKNKVISVALLIMAALVAYGRVIALVHTPIDVIGGLACAFAAAILVYGRQLFKTKLLL